MTRAVRVIDLMTNLDMQAFHSIGGLTAFINRFEVSCLLNRSLCIVAAIVTERLLAEVELV